MVEYISNASAASTAFSAAAAAAAEAAAAEVRADMVRGERAISQHLCSGSAQMVLVAVVQAKQQSIYQSALPGGELAEQETSKRKSAVAVTLSTLEYQTWTVLVASLCFFL